MSKAVRLICSHFSVMATSWTEGFGDYHGLAKMYTFGSLSSKRSVSKQKGEAFILYTPYCEKLLDRSNCRFTSWPLVRPKGALTGKLGPC